MDISAVKIMLRTQGFRDEKRISKVILENGDILPLSNGELIKNPRTGEVICYGRASHEINV